MFIRLLKEEKIRKIAINERFSLDVAEIRDFVSVC